MHIADSLSQLILPTGPERQKLAQDLRPGQILQATVVSPNTGSGLRVQIGPLELVVRTPLNAEAGQRLAVEIVQAGELPQVRLLQPTAGGTQAADRLLQLVIPPGPERDRLSQTLRPGQILQATVVNPHQAPLLKLRIATLELLARLPLAQLTEQKLTLEVIRGGERPELRLLPSGKETAAAPAERLLQLILPPGPQRPQWLQALRPGQLLQATVSTPPTGSGPTLQIGTLELPLRSPVSYTAGQQLLLEVVQSGELPQLRQLRLPVTGEAPLQALRLALPNQSAPTELFQALRNVLAHAPEGSLPPQLMQGIHKVLGQALSKEGGISADPIRQAFMGSGLFLEPLLASGQTPGADFKDSLLRLLLQLRPAVKGAGPSGHPGRARSDGAAAAQGTDLMKYLEDLLRQAEGSLARVRLHQLSSLPSEDNLRQVWQFEIPVQGPHQVDSFWVRFEREQGRSSEQTDAAWNLTLNFDIPPLGRIEARLRLQGEEISSLFRAEHPQSAALLEQNLPRLNDALQRAGLKVGRLQATPGAVHPPAATAPAAMHPLLDEQA